MLNSALTNMLFTVTLFAMGIASTASAAADGNEILRKLDALRTIASDTSFIVEIQDFRGAKAQTTKYKVYNKGMKLSRVETIFPERQAGRKLLMKEDDLWLFTPDIKRPTRVSLQQRLTGEVSNGDIVRTTFANDYDAEVKGEEKMNGVDAYHLYLKKKREEVTYPTAEMWVAKKDNAPIRADFKTSGGKNLKTALYLKATNVLGTRQFLQVEITSALDKKQKSVLNFSGYKKEKLDESFFNKESLSN